MFLFTGLLLRLIVVAERQHTRFARVYGCLLYTSLGQKKNRIILVRKEAKLPKKQFRSLLNGVLVQERDPVSYTHLRAIGAASSFYRYR